MNDFHKRLAQTIRDVGEELIEQAEDISGTNPMLSTLTITVVFDPDFNMLSPTIEVNKAYLCKRAIDRLRKGENGNESNC